MPDGLEGLDDFLTHNPVDDEPEGDEVKMFDTIHADGCTTNLGVIGAECNCGSEVQKKHTLQQVIEWGNEQCPHQVARLGGGKWINPDFRIKRKYCEDCWAELRKEAEK